MIARILTRLPAILTLALILTPVYAETLAAGNYRFTLPADGRLRSYYVHIPNALPSPYPVVISLHGGGGNAQQHRRSTGMDAAADRDGYAAVYPNGSGRLPERLLTWNAGFCCGYAQKKNIDDVTFIATLIDDLARRTDIDLRRIYVSGHSNGGMMAHRLGEALPDRLAAVASVAGAYIPTSAPADRAIPVMHIHSIDDPRALYYGGLGPPFPLTRQRAMHPPVGDMISAWLQRNACATTSSEQDFREWNAHTARLLVYKPCSNGAEIAHWQLTGAGHGWPGSEARWERLLGPSTQVIDANRETWRFFNRFSLPD